MKNFMVVCMLLVAATFLFAQQNNPRTLNVRIVNNDLTPILAAEHPNMSFVATSAGDAFTLTNLSTGCGFLFIGGNTYAQVQLGNFQEQWVMGDVVTVTVTRVAPGVPGVAQQVVTVPDATSNTIWWGRPGAYPGSPIYLPLWMINVTSHPSGAAIIRDGENTGLLTPNSFTTIPGDYLEVTITGYTWLPQSFIVIDTGQNYDIHFEGNTPPPAVVMQIQPLITHSNTPVGISNLEQYFFSLANLSYSVSNNIHLSWNSEGNSIQFIPEPGWYGIEYVQITASDLLGQSISQVVKITVMESLTLSENFDHGGSFATGWDQTHSGTTTFPWQPVLIEGSNYAMKTYATTGNTANERMRSAIYNLSTIKDVVVSFDSNFLPYGTGTGSFAYTLNNATYTVVESYSTAHNGNKQYTIPALDGKSSVRFRWIYNNSIPNSGQENYWVVDNFRIYGLVKDISPPSAVTGFTLVSMIAETVTFSWQESSDTYFDRYELYVSDDAVVTTADWLWSVSQDPQLAYSTTTITTITALSEQTYWVAIRAVDQSANPSALSVPIEILFDNTPPTITDPIPNGQPTPDWQNSRTVNIGCTINDFNILSSTDYRVDVNGNGIYDPEETWNPVITRKSRSISVVEVQITFPADGIFAFEFKAIDHYGNIAYSGMSGFEGIVDDWVVRIDTSPPTGISLFYVQSVGDFSIDLSWAPSSDLNFSAYQIYCATHPEVNTGDPLWSIAQDPNMGSHSYPLNSTTITGLLPGTRYYFLLRAIDAFGYFCQYPTIITAVTTSPYPPSAPQNVQLAVEMADVYLSWQAVTTDTEGNPLNVNRYDIYIGDHHDFTCDVNSYLDSTELTQYTVYGVAEDAAILFFKVIAVSGSIRYASPLLRTK